MLFNSFEFLLFFPIVTFLYFLLPHKYRWLHLLIASCYFYMFFVPVYIVILAGTIVVDYFAGILIESADGFRRKVFLTMSIIANVGVLAVFKYYNFFIDNINTAFHSSLPLLKILLPIGLSFHTFQAMSYTIEVYRGNQKAERNFGIYSLYVMFYPQLVAGPIERPQNMLHQFYEKHQFSYEKATSGLRQMAWGLFKKAVVADRICSAIDPVFNAPANYSSSALLIAAIMFSFQIYCDFSGYSDIALGSARVMGFELMQNFDHPYRAKSISNFWRRWHISLSTWFKDYLYIPLGGNRVSIARGYLNVFIVFLVSGFWHGANWTFIVWGALHGTFTFIENITATARMQLKRLLRLDRSEWLNTQISRAITFILVTLAWVFFRANKLSDAVYILKKISGVVGDLARQGSKALSGPVLLGGLKPDVVAGAAISIVFMEVVHLVEGKENIYDIVGRKNKPVRWAIYTICFIFIYYFGVFDNKQFIYFQF